MKTRNTKTGCEVAGAATSAFAGPAAYCRALLECLGALKTELLEQFREEFALTSHDHLIRRSLDEAEALAWLTPFPHLFLPALAEEKVRDVRAWRERQQQIWLRQRRRQADFIGSR